MGPVSAEVEIDLPRQRVFEAIADLARRRSFTDHFVSDFHLTRIDPRGVGAGARFRIPMFPRAIWMDTAITEIDPPHMIVERGCGGRANRIPSVTVWELHEGSGPLTRVRVAFWTEPPGHLDRLLEKLSGASMRLERDWREALLRLRDQLESEAPPEAPVAVAGGNAHATGIP
jgi:uncharacterized protein YndB with AHSA1/START domain